MADLWYPDGVYDPAPSGVWGTFTDFGEPKLLLHTTESRTGVYSPDPNMGAGRRYYGNTGTWPNYTLAWHARSNGWRVYNHIPANRSSLSLRNRAGGVQTNRDNVTQVEIAARAVEIGSLPGQAMDELAKLLVWEHLARGVPLTSTVRWVPYPASYGEGASQRLSGPAWDGYAGILGHEHAPENDHGDPGDFPIQALLSRANDIAQGDDVTEQDKIDIANRVLEALRVQVFSVSPPIRQAGPGQVIGATYNKVGDAQTVLRRVTDQLTAIERLVTPATPAFMGADAAEVSDVAAEVSDRLDFLYTQLNKIANAAEVTLDPAPWRESASP